MGEFYEWRDAPDAEFAVIGDPIAHSWSPRIFQAAFSASLLSCRYVAVRVPKGELALALQHMSAKGYRGVNVTVPLKEEAFATTNSLEVHGAVNTVRLPDLESTSTDGPGLVAALRQLGSGPNLLLLGAGGTVRSVITSLLANGFKVSIWNRSMPRASQLVNDLGITVPIIEQAATSGFDTVINATSATLDGKTVPVDWSGEGLAMDLMYGSDPSPFLRFAEEAGWMAVDGREMLVQQAALSYQFWFGHLPNIEAMRGALP